MIQKTNNNIEEITNTTNTTILHIEDWQLLENTEEIVEKNKIQSYIISDINNTIFIDSKKSIFESLIFNSKDYIISDNTKYMISILQKSLKEKIIMLILDNNLINILKNPSLYLTIGNTIANISIGIANNILVTYNAYSTLLDKTIHDKTVNFYYSKALEIAYLQLINECINECIPFILKMNTLNRNKHYIFAETIAINIANDMLLISIKKITYVFSKSYFLNNSYIQNKIRELICKLIENITVSFLNGVLEGAFYIIIENNK
jgi:hypothetical protein